ncbi:uncharacterized protein ASCRUDRAFT_74890 [Ascoidea rubescens DSM 1968]|uniref:Uncharacterized protein n=1 Tax=Ascoidea rubescens DSM 1968 TaxID=1344418 RepID=A0A1D2VLN0_9ASCO|nr:hypothetical protein ASCRUDRAFT_74890 [Ascoidea rubescens DSM 1968]ODV62528.1 hypothetical protein ASCRUDRAFT_74890 [Ascoidea rubescens DSM 1968]
MTHLRVYVTHKRVHLHCAAAFMCLCWASQKVEMEMSLVSLVSLVEIKPKSFEESAINFSPGNRPVLF